MRNDDVEIDLRRRGGRVYYTYRKVNGRWQQDVANGNVYDVTAEQVLSHLLPVLAGTKPDVEIVVRRA